MLDTFAKEKFRLGVVAGFVYADSRVNDFIADPAHRDWIVPVASDAENLRNLLAGAIDGFFADRIAAATTAWRRGAGAPHRRASAALLYRYSFHVESRE